jgi:hypothetical protein
VSHAHEEDLQSHAKRHRLVSPQLLMQIKFFYQAMIRAPGWLLDENIQFENALGEMRSLPFTYFQHLKVCVPNSNLSCIQANKFKVFESFLEADFKGKPGELQVALHHYQILNTTGARLNGPSWLQTVRPGAQVYMSINIPRNVSEIMPEDRTLQRVSTITADRAYSGRAAWVYKTW